MKTTYLLLLFSSFLGTTFSQTLSPSVIALAGGYEKTPSGMTVSWTLGEPVVDPIKSGNVYLTQGFQQPSLVVSTGFEDPQFSYGLKVFPNPVSDQLMLETDYPDIMQYQIVDPTGKKLRNGEWTIHTAVDISDFQPGMIVIYFLADGRMVRSDLITVIPRQ